MTPYPARIMFALAEPQRTRLVSVARAMGLPVEEDPPSDTCVVVTVPNAETAYEFGHRSFGAFHGDDPDGAEHR
jgi:hypothetical protein